MNINDFINGVQNRFKSPVLLTALASQLYQFTQNIINKQMQPEELIVNLVMTVLIILGIINNPTIKDKF